MNSRDESVFCKEIWEKFILSGDFPPAVTRTAVAQSWLNCVENGVNPTGGKGRVEIDQFILQEKLEQYAAIVRTAKPFMQNLYQFFRSSGFIVVLADTQGYILENFGDDTCLKNAHYLNFIPGANWGELQVGTNAIGLVLSGKSPVQISGCEHFCREHHWWTCAAAPILDEHGRMVAVLDISGPCQSVYPHTLGMVVAAAEAITMQLRIQRQYREVVLAHQRMNGVFNIMSEGIIIVDRNGLIHNVNGTTRKLFKATDDVVGQPVEAAFSVLAPFTRNILDKASGYTEKRVLIPTAGGLKNCLISGETIADERGNISGGIIMLRPLQPAAKSGYHAGFRFDDIIGQSPAMEQAVHLARLAAAGCANILLQGESGTGKEMFAQAIHQHSSRRAGPFVAVNCGAIPRELIGSELFGYADGAFTGAKRGGRPGKFELAAGGTLFLDEIGDMPLEQQVALLRVLQEKKLSRLGSEELLNIDVRIICATNKNLLQAVEQGSFRRDLYYRLNVISLTIPPLRERGEDSLLLFRHFIRLAGQERGRPFSVAEEVFNALTNYEWPGNVRELHNVAERAVHLADGGSITVMQLPAEMLDAGWRRQLPAGSRQPADRNFYRARKQRQQAEQEQAELLELLEQHGGNISRIAKCMGVARTTVYRKLRLYGLEYAQEEQPHL